jgi:hypothetical protein
MRRNRTSSLSTIDARSIQLVRCCAAAWSASARWHSLHLCVSVTWRLPTQQHSPAHCRAAIPSPQCAVPLTNFLCRFFSQLHQPFADLSLGGDEGIRTPGLRRAKAALSQTELHPHIAYGVVGLTGFEPVTPALSAQCSNQLSYRPGVQTRP